MSGPLQDGDPEVVPGGAPSPAAVEVQEGRATEVGGLPVTRVLPRRPRRTVGAWCFVDVMGPVPAGGPPMRVGPHPHIGLQTVTWLLAGEAVHTDSLGSEQPIRPGQLNLMTAGHGVAHAEEAPATADGHAHGVQLWVAQPDATRHGPAAFEHHAALPQVAVGPTRATVLVGELAGERSPAQVATPLVGAELAVGGPTQLDVDPGFEHAVVPLTGGVSLDGVAVAPGSLAHVGAGRERLLLDGAGARALLLGGPPFGEQLLMWWNFVARTEGEVTAAWRDWQERSGRFAHVESGLARIDAPRPHWLLAG